MNPEEAPPAVMSDDEARRLAESLDPEPEPRDDTEETAFAE